MLEKGRATAAIVHQGATNWRLDVGPFDVRIVGTRFDVGWDTEEEVFELGMREGTVVVSGAFLREPQRVCEGETLRAFVRERREELLRGRSGASGSLRTP